MWWHGERRLGSVPLPFLGFLEPRLPIQEVRRVILSVLQPCWWPIPGSVGSSAVGSLGGEEKVGKSGGHRSRSRQLPDMALVLRLGAVHAMCALWARRGLCLPGAHTPGAVTAVQGSLVVKPGLPMSTEPRVGHNGAQLACRGSGLDWRTMS